MKKEYTRWAILWPSENKLEGKRNLLMGNASTEMVWLFLTRNHARMCQECRGYNEMLRRRPDLRAEPHGWRARRPVKVKVTVETV